MLASGGDVCSTALVMSSGQC